MDEFLRRLRHAPDWWLHPPRRRAVLALLARLSVPADVLVVCHGNICRSPFAAAVLRRELTSCGVRVGSAGFFGPGRHVPATAAFIAARHGVDLSTHVSRLVTADDVRHADLVIAMDVRQAHVLRRRFDAIATRMLLLGDLDPVPIQTRQIADPVDQPAAVYADVYARIERCAENLVSALTSRESERPVPA